MTVLAGNPTYASDVNADVAKASLGRIAQTDATANAAATSGTTELAVDQVTISAVNGYRYKITWNMSFTGTVVADTFLFRIRLGSGTGGSQLVYTCPAIPFNSGNQATVRQVMVTEWTASSTASQTFTATVVRNSGTGTATVTAASSALRTLSVDYVSG